MRVVALAIASLLLTACATTDSVDERGASGASSGKPVNRNDGRYSQAQDSYPDNPPNLDSIPDAVPRYEPRSRNGNRDYEVLGKNYRVLGDTRGFSETGKASFYGTKFHGHLTSNGEIYDMYSMSAAHKNLPLPSYARVTNLENGKSTVVRVNDRGPFHEGRVIDLSYAAAHRLGVLAKGTARVRVEAIHVPPGPNDALGGTAIQVAAVSDESRAQSLAAKLRQRWGQPTRVVRDGKLFKVQFGPFTSNSTAEQLLYQLRGADYPKAFLVD
ncbi:MAG: septal ring lytic transglycosylase RlpA family protein [Gammaproteobacteria bacterium]|nr:septal ring lytic transglycosylase RlpA family protein [Gammaproteobacteria bacterium]